MSDPAPIVASEDRYTHDVIVIGGGVNGTGVARDCALRGLRVALFEKHDLAFGASGNNSGMIHGGARYLLDTPSVTEQSCRDSGYIQRIAPHLLFRVPFLVPVPARGAKSAIALAALDAFFAFYDRYQPLKRGKPHTLLGAGEVRSIEPGLAANIRGAITFDEWGIDGARLSALNAVDAREHGADVHLHHEVFEILRHTPEEGGGVRGVVARDRIDGGTITATARIVVNATGAWAPITAKIAGADRLELRPGKGIHVVFDRRLSNYAIATRAIDGRQVFMMPWSNVSWIGTTDDDYYGDLDHVRATTDEVRYLIQAVSRVFPAVREARVIGTTAGVRPTLPGWGMYEDDLSREHEIIDHAADGVARLYSMIGGKLASYRLFAEQMTDLVVRALGSDVPCSTHERPLPGGDGDVDAAPLAERFAVAEHAARRIVHRHGTRAERVLARISHAPEERAVVCACEPVLECEVRHACREEGARTIADVARRTRLGLGACGGMRCAHRAAQIVAQEHGRPLSRAHAMASQFLRERYASRAVALDGAQVAQDELLASHLAYSGALDVPPARGGAK